MQAGASEAHALQWSLEPLQGGIGFAAAE